MAATNACCYICRDRSLPCEGMCATCGKAFAPANIALCKYWGKRDRDLNLPVNSSLSISLGKLGNSTTIGTYEVAVFQDHQIVRIVAVLARIFHVVKDVFLRVSSEKCEVRCIIALAH